MQDACVCASARGAGAAGDQLGLQFARMDWRDRDVERPASRDAVAPWKAGGGGRSSLEHTYEAMDWGEREMPKEEPFVLKSPRRAKRKQARALQRSRKATVKVQAQARKTAKQKEFTAAKQATVCMQAHARRVAAAASLARIRAAAIFIQARARGQ